MTATTQDFHDVVALCVKANRRAVVVRDSAKVLLEMAEARVAETQAEWDEALRQLYAHIEEEP